MNCPCCGEEMQYRLPGIWVCPQCGYQERCDELLRVALERIEWAMSYIRDAKAFVEEALPEKAYGRAEKRGQAVGALGWALLTLRAAREIIQEYHRMLREVMRNGDA